MAHNVMIYTYMFIYIKLLKFEEKEKNYKMNLLNKRFWLDNLLTKKLKLYKSEMNSSVSSCQSVANLK